ncbi:MAG: sugar ABC transporter substrate-binding protein [Eubacteriales bacterium]|nr:sugar ABC transporter substrate-binding protein [Eubacteriales bacterium]
MKTTKRVVSMILAGGMFVGMLAGCGSSSSTTTQGSGSGESSDHLKINVVVNTLSSEYWGYVEAGARAYGEEHENVEVTVQGPPSETSYDEQQNMIETSVTSGGYDGLVISALQTDTAENLISGAEIPIISVNTKLNAPESLSFVGTGNENAAKEGGKAAVDAAKKAGWDQVTAINIAGVQGDPTSAERSQGFQEGIEEAGGEFLSEETQYADFVADKAVTSMEAIMQNYPEGIAIICCNNDDMAMAAAKAAKGNDAYRNTIFIGFDGIQSACESILNDEETMSVAQDPYGMGYKAVEACVAAINGEQLDAFIDTGCSVISKENAQERYDTLKGYLDK